ncbi:hypothetical protein M885DRAFT_243231 [Pelagophyceae sp. CCMP2097]|nr:hypothetical protein M885DRAFT_243231 [Pelagophyceae sp. CCMP2097]
MMCASTCSSGARMSATRLLPDIETLASRCVDHFLRTIVKMRDSSGAMEHHQIKSAENLLKVLRTWRLKWSSFNESEIIRNCIKTLKNVAQRGDKSGNGDEKPKSKRPPRDRRPEAPPSARGDSPEAPLVPMPMGLSSLIPGGAPSIARPSSLDGAALPRVMPLPPKPKTDWGQSRPAESPGAASPAGARAARRLDAGGAKRFDVCRLLSDVCDALRHSRGTKSTAFYFLHYFLQHAASEPPEHAPLAVNKARHAAEMARYGKAAESSKAQLLAREAYVATLDDDELVALALAATHLAGKATDTPQRLSYILDAVRAPQGSAAKRRWPAAAPHREQVLLAEVRLLRCICFDTRTVDSETALGDFCETLDDFEYVSKWRARLNTAAPPPPPKKGGEDDLAIAKKMFHAALDVSASLAFHASGLVTEHRPEALMAACVLCASKTATWSDDAQSEKIGLPQDWLDSAAKKCGTHAAQLRGIASEVETTGDDLQEYFGFAKELPSAAVVRQLRCDAAKRAAQATLKRLCDEALPRSTTAASPCTTRTTTTCWTCKGSLGEIYRS